MTAENLRCEYQMNPLCVDAERPRLSWTLSSQERNKHQTAFHILVASSAELLARDSGDLWDSGRVESAQAAQVEYGGVPMESFCRYFWKVRVWDERGYVGDWSEIAEWGAGILREEDWGGAWMASQRRLLTAGPLERYRKPFVTDKPVRRAVVYSTSAGFHEVFLNGRKAGDAVLAPHWTNFRRTIYYVANEVTELLRDGENVIAGELANGFYSVPGGRYTKYTASFGTPEMRIMLRIEHTDGSVSVVGSDHLWRVKEGPITFSCIYGGEDFDARRDESGWSEPGFDDSSWAQAGYYGAPTDCRPGGKLLAQIAPPLKVMQRFQGVEISRLEPGKYIYDFGQNFAGWPRLRVRGKAGATIRIKPGELLDADGRLNQQTSVGISKTEIYFSYTLKGNGVEEWHPRYSYTGFRYAEVTVSGEAEIISLEGEFVHSSTARAGAVSFSNELLNRIDRLVDCSVRSNFQAVLTDCPHREKLGWLEVAHLMGPSILYNYDAAPFYAKVTRDMADAQQDSGLVPDIAPEYTVFQGGFRDSPEWGSAMVLVPWMLYRWFGDTRVLAENYSGMTRYAGYLASAAVDGVLYQGLGDWYDIGSGAPGPSKLTPAGVMPTAFYYQNLLVLERTATLLGKTDDADRFAKAAAQVRVRFHETFFQADKGYYATGSQAAQAIALVYDLVPEKFRAGVIKQLVHDVESRGNKQTAGDVGYRYLIRALIDAGRSDILYRMNTRTDNPSYGYQLSQGVTSLAEAWDATPATSQNHCMLGHVQEWFMSGLAGIGQETDSAGFERIVIRPDVPAGLEKVSAHYDSIRGRIESEWFVESGRLNLRVKIPANCTARIFIPSLDGAAEEGGLPVREAAGVKAVECREGYCVVAAGSGEYQFCSGAYRK
ncbi:MAG: family 78 glycoside hydrolase catalytic domain [Kiritimatiellales bacterium]|jgi:hypothetical protein